MIFTLISIILGAIFLIFGLTKCLAIKKVIPKRLLSRWNVILALLGFFVLGYLFSLMIFFNENFHMLLMGFVYLLAGIFVAIISSLTSNTIHALNENEEIKKLNIKLKEKSGFLYNVIESLNHPFYVIDVNNYKIKMANSAARLGKIGSEFTCYELTHKRNEPCGKKEHICPIDRVKKTRKSVIVEHIHYDKDGNPRNMEVHAHPIFDDNGILVEMIEYSLDITERKKTERKTQHLNKNLSIAKNELENLLEQKDEIIHMIGHDLKNPLQPILMLLPLVEENVEDPKLKEMLQISIRNAKSLKKMLFKTLEFAKQSELGMKVDFSNIRLNENVSNLIENRQVLFTESNIAVENMIDEKIMVNADKLLLDEVFDNLFTNAVKYSQEKDGMITVDALDENDFVKVSVRDTGIGLTKEQLGHIFDKFYKNDDVKHIMDSHGLGLSICKHIVEKHGGKIWAESPGLGKGTTMFFTLPLSYEKLVEVK